jgi:hypothetical protein
VLTLDVLSLSGYWGAVIVADKFIPVNDEVSENANPRGADGGPDNKKIL